MEQEFSSTFGTELPSFPPSFSSYEKVGLSFQPHPHYSSGFFNNEPTASSHFQLGFPLPLVPTSELAPLPLTCFTYNSSSSSSLQQQQQPIFDSLPDLNLKLPKPEPIEYQQPNFDTQLPEASSNGLKRKKPSSCLTPFNANSTPFPKTPKPSTPNVIPSSELARKRRKLVSEKTLVLEKLMPWEKKMNMASMLGEAQKYIKFLQAQVGVLQSMPYLSSFRPLMENSSNNDAAGLSFGGLEKLNRQQLLQVLVNSPVAQTFLSSKESCVFSLEQVVFLKRVTDAKANLLQKLVLLAAASSRD
ncbi:hypothetical protein IFM89_036694 [Coptis chinensis]|uniref:BHLH domain-containing protein n=1 Tax=Coptis chinensis TaxID=261450 RepID=A0A835I618_9MAGN|nr:hypothetical protein IFM89_036694 [Coptis chinensis]